MSVEPAAGAAAVAVFGEVLFDCFPDGSRVLGGAPFNVAWHLQAMGAAPVLVSAVGEDAAAQEVRRAMTRWGMSTGGLQIDPDHPTGEVRVELRGGQPSFDIVADRAYDHIRADELPDDDFGIVYHGSLAVRGPESRRSLAALLERTGAPSFVDVNLRPPWSDLEELGRSLDRARWVKLNEDELEVIVGERGEPGRLGERLADRHGLDLVVITRGERGALAVGGDGSRHEAAAPGDVRVVDTVGAGDALSAVCVLGLLHAWPVAHILERGQRLAGRVIGQRGAVSERTDLYAGIAGDGSPSAG